MTWLFLRLQEKLLYDRDEQGVTHGSIEKLYDFIQVMHLVKFKTENIK